jgi:hypothetical protein
MNISLLDSLFKFIPPKGVDIFDQRNDFFQTTTSKIDKNIGDDIRTSNLTYLHFMTPPSIDIDDTVGIR